MVAEQLAECCLEHSAQEAGMGFLDRVKEKASEGIEKGQELAKTQQMKLELKKLEGQLDEAYTAYGRKAYQAASSGSLTADALTPEADAIREATATVEAKRAELDAVGAVS
jgi:hypothetical protein